MADTIKFSEHPDFLEQRPNWKESKVLHDGTRKDLISSDYLWYHEFEKNVTLAGQDLETGLSSARAIREQRTRYVNRYKPIARKLTSLLFKNDVNVKEVEKVFGKDTGEIKNVDGQKTSLVNFCKKVATNYFLYGKPIVTVESFNIDAPSAGEEKKLGLRPFMRLWNPLNVPDWQVETADPSRMGEYNDIRFEYTVIPERADLLDEPHVYRYTQTYALRDNVFTIKTFRSQKPIENTLDTGEVDWEFVDTKDIPNWDRLPVSILDGESWLEPVTPIALLRHNVASAYDNVNLFQAHRHIILVGPEIDGPVIVLNEAAVNSLPEGTEVHVVDASDPVALRNRIAELDSSMVLVAFDQHRSRPADAKAVESDDTIREGKDDFLTALKSAGLIIEDLCNDAIRNYGKFKNTEVGEEEGIKLDLDISIEDVNQTVQVMRAHWDVIKQHGEWTKQSNKKLAGMMNLGDIDAVIEEIDKQPQLDTEERSARRRALLSEATGDNFNTDGKA